VSGEHLVLLNLNPTVCRLVLLQDKPEDAQVRHRPVNMFLMDDKGDFNKNLSEAFLRLWGEAGLDFPLPVSPFTTLCHYSLDVIRILPALAQFISSLSHLQNNYGSL